MNTTRIPHRSIYTPDHTRFAFEIIRKYHTTTDNYLGMLGLTFRENQLTEGLDTAPLYEYMVHLHLQLQQLKHESNTFIGSRLNTLQLLQKKWIANVEYIQANKKLIYNSTSPNKTNRSEHLLQTSIVNLKEAITFSVIQNKLTWRLVDRNIASVIEKESMPFNTIQQISSSVNTSNSRSSLVERTLQLHINRLKAFTIWNPLRKITSELSVRNFGSNTIKNNNFNAHFAENSNFIHTAQRLLLIDRKQQDRQFITINQDTKPNRTNLYKQYNDALSASWAMTEVTNRNIHVFQKNELLLRLKKAQQYILKTDFNLVYPTEHSNVMNQIIIDQRLINRGFTFITENTNSEQQIMNQSFANYELNSNTALNRIAKANFNFLNNDNNTTALVDIPTVLLIDRKQIERGLITKLAEESVLNQNINTSFAQSIFNQQSLTNRSTISNDIFINYLMVKQTKIQNRENDSFLESRPVVLLINSRQIERGLITKLAEERVLNQNISTMNRHTLTHEFTTIGSHFTNYLRLKQTTILNNETSFEELPAVILVDRKEIERGLITALAEESVLNHTQSMLNQQSLINRSTNSNNNFLNYLMVKQTNFQNNEDNTSFESRPSVLLIDRKQIERGLITTLAKESTLLQMQNTSTNLPHEMRRLRDIAAKEYIKTNRYFISRIVSERIGELSSSVQLMFLQSDHNLLYQSNLLTIASSNSQLPNSLKYIQRRNRVSSNILETSANDQAIRPQLKLLERLINTNLSSIIMQKISIKHKLNSKQTHSLSGIVKDTILTNNQYESVNELIIEKKSLPKENLTEQIVRERIDYWSSLVQLLPNIVHNHLLKNVNNALDVLLELNQRSATAINHRQSLMLVDRRIINQEQYNAVQTNLAPIQAQLQVRTINTFKAFNTSDKVTYMLKELKQLSHVSHLQSASTVPQTSLIARLLHNQFNYAMMQRLSHTILAKKGKTLIRTNDLTNSVGASDAMGSLYYQSNLTNHIVNERLGDITNVLQLLPIHTTNSLLQPSQEGKVGELAQHENANKEFSSLKLIDRSLIARGILSAVTVIMQKPKFKQQTHQVETSGRRTELLKEARPVIIGPKQLQTVIQLNERRTKLAVKGPVMTYHSSLSPIIYQRFASEQMQNMPPKQINRVLGQTAPSVTQLPAPYYESLTNKIVQDRVNELTSVMQLMTLTNQTTLVNSVQMSTAAQQEFDRQIEKQIAAVSEKNPGLVLVDRNRNEHNLLETVTVILEKQMNPNLIKPDSMTDRTHRKLALNETMTTINEETLLLNRMIQKEAAAGNQIVRASISETTAALDYLKTKPAGSAETNQSSSTALSIAAHNQPEIKIDKTELNAAQFPKQEFDKIVDKVFKEIQKRFTFERQRRGM